MSQKKKLLQKAINNPRNFSYKNLETLLKHYDFKKVKTNAGSHMKWRNEEKLITYFVPKANPVKIPYIKNFLNILKAHFQSHF